MNLPHQLLFCSCYKLMLSSVLLIFLLFFFTLLLTYLYLGKNPNKSSTRMECGILVPTQIPIQNFPNFWVYEIIDITLQNFHIHVNISIPIQTLYRHFSEFCALKMDDSTKQKFSHLSWPFTDILTFQF